MTNVMTLEIKKTAHVYDEGEQLWYSEFRFPAIDGTPTNVEVRRDLCEPGQLRQTLLARGAELPQIDDCRADLRAIVAEDAPEKRRAASNGWSVRKVGGSPEYVSFKFVDSKTDQEELLPPVDRGAVGANIAVAGSLDMWKELVAVSRYSTMMIVALCAAFAAPLLSLFNRQSFGLVFFGPSRVGKTTIQLVCASVVGYGTEEELPTFKTTEAGLLDLGLMFADHVLVINEVGTASGRKEKIAQALYEATYSLMSGHDKQRHRSWQGRVGEKNSFRIITVGSSEFSPDEWAARAGQARDPGETARMIAVPVLLDGSKSVFDSMPTDVADRDADAWDSAQYARLREGLPHHRGVAHREFIRKVVVDPDAVITRARAVASRFENKMTRPEMTPVQRDVVSKFALLAAGGALAVEFGVLPLAKREVREACEQACVAAIGALPDPRRQLAKYLTKIRSFLDGASIVDRGSASKYRLADMSGADGYVVTSGREKTYTIRATVLKDMLGDAGLVEVLGWFDDEGLLLHNKNRKAGRAIEWAESQANWPDGTRPRSFVIRLPRGLHEFERILDPL